MALLWGTEDLAVGLISPGGTFNQLKVSDCLVQVLSPKQVTLLIFTGQKVEPDDLIPRVQLAQDVAAHFPGLLIGQVIGPASTRVDSPPDQSLILLNVDSKVQFNWY